MTMDKGCHFFRAVPILEFRFPGYSRFCTEPTREAKADDTLVSVRAPVGALNMAWERWTASAEGWPHFATNQVLGHLLIFLFGQLFSLSFKCMNRTGTVFGAITRKQFEAMRMLTPTDQLVSAFGHCHVSTGRPNPRGIVCKWSQPRRPARCTTADAGFGGSEGRTIGIGIGCGGKL